MMMGRVLFVMSLAASLASGQAPGKFVGVWKLISFEQRTTAGEVSHPLGQKRVGRLTYDASGHMSAQLMLPDRPKFEAPSKVRGVGGAEDRRLRWVYGLLRDLHSRRGASDSNPSCGGEPVSQLGRYGA